MTAGCTYVRSMGDNIGTECTVHSQFLDLYVYRSTLLMCMYVCVCVRIYVCACVCGFVYSMCMNCASDLSLLSYGSGHDFMTSEKVNTTARQTNTAALCF